MINRQAGATQNEGVPSGSTSHSSPTVFVVDDDPGVRSALLRLMRAAGFRALGFASGPAFLAAERPAGPACLILDLRMPGMDGLELQALMGREGVQIPTIFLTGHGDIPSTVLALKSGALTLLEKPYQDDDLLDIVSEGLERDRMRLEETAREQETRRRFARLTPREQEVMALVAQGLANKQIAWRLDIGEKTVKVHRARVMAKMQADSLAELVRLSDQLGLTARR